MGRLIRLVGAFGKKSDSRPWDAVACASVLHGGIRVLGSNNSDPTPTHPEPLCQCFKLHIHELNFSLIGKLNNEKQLYKDKTFVFRLRSFTIVFSHTEGKLVKTALFWELTILMLCANFS